MKKRYHLTTFGCQMNEHDSERMKGMLESLGYSEASERAAADLILFNRIVISPEFPRFYGMRLLAGRELSATRSLDQISSMNGGDPANTGHNILINETAAARLGFTPQQAVGQTILDNN